MIAFSLFVSLRASLPPRTCTIPNQQAFLPNEILHQRHTIWDLGAGYGVGIWREYGQGGRDRSGFLGNRGTGVVVFMISPPEQTVCHEHGWVWMVLWQ